MLYSQFLKICEIVTFDFGYQLIEKNKRKKIKDEIQKKFPRIKVEEEEFNQKIYDCEFIRINENKNPIVITGVINRKNTKNIISSYKKELSKNEENNFNTFEKKFDLNKSNFRIILDSYGIGTLRIEFNFIQNNPINTINIIESTIVAGKFVDKYLFQNYFKNKILESLYSAFKETGEIILKEHHTYSIIATNYKKSFSKNQLYGIVWKDENYNKVQTVLTNKIVKDMALESSDNFIISQPAAFIRVCDVDFSESYFQNRVKALEILRRQYHLLKKFDFQLSEVIEKKEESNLSSLINRIIQIQDNIFLLSEFYKNIKIFTMQEYMYIFERGNAVFRVNDLYESLKSKIDWSYNIVNNLIQEQRNNLLRRLEIAGFIFTSIVFVINMVHPLLVQFFSSFGFNPKIGFIFRTFLIPLFDLIISIFIAWFGYQIIEKDSWLKRKILRKR